MDKMDKRVMRAIKALEELIAQGGGYTDLSNTDLSGYTGHEDELISLIHRVHPEWDVLVYRDWHAAHYDTREERKKHGIPNFPGDFGYIAGVECWYTDRPYPSGYAPVEIWVKLH